MRNKRIVSCQENVIISYETDDCSLVSYEMDGKMQNITLR